MTRSSHPSNHECVAASEEQSLPDIGADAPPPRRRLRRRIAAAVIALLFVLGVVGFLNRQPPCVIVFSNSGREPLQALLYVHGRGTVCDRVLEAGETLSFRVPYSKDCYLVAMTARPGTYERDAEAAAARKSWLEILDRFNPDGMHIGGSSQSNIKVSHFFMKFPVFDAKHDVFAADGRVVIERRLAFHLEPTGIQVNDGHLSIQQEFPGVGWVVRTIGDWWNRK